LQTWLKHLLTLPDVTLNWLAAWAGTDPSLAPARMADFWGTLAAEGDLPEVAAAFTVAGKIKIEGAIDEIEAALFEPLLLAGAKSAFAEWYQKAISRSGSNL
jgi:hypothetical protein